MIKMAGDRKELAYHTEDLKNFLICTNCSRFPRPRSNIYTCPKCFKVVCSSCFDFNNFCDDCTTDFGCCWPLNVKRPVELIIDSRSTKFASAFKIYPCLFLNNGCKDEFEPKDLQAHENVCTFRDVTCPSLKCSEKIIFDNISSHYLEKHPTFTIEGDTMIFKEKMETLLKQNFMLYHSGKSFFPQFYLKRNTLRIWVVLQGNEEEARSFSISFDFLKNGESQRVYQDRVYSINRDKNQFISGNVGLTCPLPLNNEQEYLREDIVFQLILNANSENMMAERMENMKAELKSRLKVIGKDMIEKVEEEFEKKVEVEVYGAHKIVNNNYETESLENSNLKISNESDVTNNGGDRRKSGRFVISQNYCVPPVRSPMRSAPPVPL